jgi:hypothetical protein
MYPKLKKSRQFFDSPPDGRYGRSFYANDGRGEALLLLADGRPVVKKRYNYASGDIPMSQRNGKARRVSVPGPSPRPVETVPPYLVDSMVAAFSNLGFGG